MSESRDYPWSAIREALESLFGWTGLMFLMSLAGCVCGFWIGHAKLTPLSDVLNLVIWVPVLWLVFPQIIVACVVTITVWYVCIHFATSPAWAIASLLPFLVWLMAIGSIAVAFRLE